MDSESPPAEKGFPRKLFLPALILTVFSLGISGSIATLLSVDIATTFFGSPTSTAIAAVSQLHTASNAAALVSAFLLSILAVRFRRKPLLLFGLVLVAFSAVGSFFAPTLNFLLVFYAIEGIGSVMVGLMAITLIGDVLPLKQKPKAISYITAASSLASVVGILVLSYLAEVAGWQFTFLYLMLPLTLTSLVLTSFVLPSKSREKSASLKENHYIRSFKQVFKNRSATACLFANFFTNAGFNVAVFALAFFQIQFKIPRVWRTGIVEAALILVVIAPLVAGPLVNRFGAKRLTLVSSFLSALCVMIFFFIPNFWISLSFDMLHVWFTAWAGVAYSCLILDQIPKFRGTLVSLNRIFNGLGETIAPAIGGAALFLTGGVYGSIGLVLGGMTIAGLAILYLYAKDPTITPS
jgi:DHA1 family bicyclomycin/chloramphenicol resistance-like MFS transporter